MNFLSIIWVSNIHKILKYFEATRTALRRVRRIRDAYTLQTSRATGQVNGGSATGDTLISIENISGGSQYNDTLIGDDNDNYLNGNTGDDIVDGGNGNDLLNGGWIGNDTITGGAGADIFDFDWDWGNDTVTDFEDGLDMIDLSDTNLIFTDLTIVQNNTDVIITDPNGNSITLENALVSNITADDFIF